MKKLLLLLLLVITSCAPIYVVYDFEKGTDFSQYKTYNYYDGMQTGLSELDFKRLREALDIEMKDRGFILSNTPDFFIDIKSKFIALSTKPYIFRTILPV